MCVSELMEFLLTEWSYVFQVSNIPFVVNHTHSPTKPHHVEVFSSNSPGIRIPELAAGEEDKENSPYVINNFSYVIVSFLFRPLDSQYFIDIYLHCVCCAPVYKSKLLEYENQYNILSINLILILKPSVDHWILHRYFIILLLLSFLSFSHQMWKEDSQHWRFN